MSTAITQVTDSLRSNIQRMPQRVLQRTCACGQHALGDTCAGCKEKQSLQRASRSTKPETQSSGAPPVVHEVLSSPGRPLDTATRGFFEPRFGHDFSNVRVHTDARASESAQSVNALAYTVGNDIVFESGKYQPSTMAGNRLLAHELTHVLQQQGTSSSIQTQIKVGAPHDSAEQEADQLADRVMSSSSESSFPVTATQSLPVVRRQVSSTELDQALAGAQTSGPQQVGQTRKVTLPTVREGLDQVVPSVIRSLVPCPCRELPETQEGAFWNPDLDNFAIAYKHCRGSRSVTAYARLQSDLSSALNAGRRPEGTVRAGTRVNINGRSNQGVIELEVLGTNEPAGVPGTTGAIPGGTPGIGGHGRVVVQAGRWTVFLDAEYVRRLGSLPGGTDPNQYSVRLGGQLGRGPSVSAGCRSAGGEFVCTVGAEVPLGREPDCFTCFCPPPTRHYECIDFILDRDELQPTVEVSHPAHEFRYYFRLDRNDPERTLVTQSEDNMSRMAAAVRDGGTIEYIGGYASPETPERHNEMLSTQRADRMTQIVQDRVGSGVPVPQGFGGGELLGRRPTASRSSRLGDVISRSGFRSAEDLSMLLSGDEIPNPELSSHFLSLFNALPEASDRLAVFGLTSDDPMAAQVLDGVRRFVASRGVGPRPWERIFRLLRVGVVRVRSTVRTPGTTTVPIPGGVRRPSNDECRRRGERAEAMSPGFGPIDPAALRPVATPEQARTECDNHPPGADDRQRGCNYNSARSRGGRPRAPEFAPFDFGQSGSRP